jgi:hypothetical protein
VIVSKERRLAAANSKWNIYFERLADHKGNEVPDYMVVEGHASSRDRVTGVALLPIINAGCAASLLSPCHWSSALGSAAGLY